MLAQKVLLEKTKGYKNHPQLIRFKAQKKPSQALSSYLHSICNEADTRGYKFNRTKIKHPNHAAVKRIFVTSEQLHYEWTHFLAKIETRDVRRFETLKNKKAVSTHPLFQVIEGKIESWEKL